MRGAKWIVAVGLGVLGAALGIVVGLGGLPSGGQATAASRSGDPGGQLDPVLNDGTKAVLKAVDQGLALVLGGKEGKVGSSGFQAQQTGWNQVKNNYDKGESDFVSTATKASDQFLNGVLGAGNPTDDLIQLLKLISSYKQKVDTAAAGWSQVSNKANFELQAASQVSVGSTSTGAGAGKLTVSDLKGATQLIQTVAGAEVTLYAKVAVAEIEYEGGILSAQDAVSQIDAAFAAFEKAITGGAKNLVKGAPVSWNQVVNKQVAPTTGTWSKVLNTQSYNLLSNSPQLDTTVTESTITSTTTTAAGPTVTTTTAGPTVTVTTTAASPTVTIQCPTPPNGDWWTPGDPMTVKGSVSPPVSEGTVTINYAASPTGMSTTDTPPIEPDGTFTDATTAPSTTEPYAQSIQANYGAALSNACPAEFAGG